MKRDAGNLIGQTFGRLTVTAFAFTHKSKGHIWDCLCQCGNTCQKSSGQLRDKSNPNPSCGCAVRDSIAKASAAAWAVTTKFRHPYKLKIKWLYRNMLKRCYDPKNKRYADYGGRGISVCDEWRKDRYMFYRWCVDNGIRPGLQIERINNDGNYCPENCRFATQREQVNNTRKNRFLTWDGKTQTVAEWARDLNVTPQSILHRVYRGWTTERIFTQPFKS